ncbi:serine/threonine-protein kinase Nek10 isoform X3 [Lepisosteus oculatus]|uniref:serine/threonine-protein kinase Nek10 isoform X3 n=1 Tax=Lepisosteus oculatus TaxID=7918 RepID=UPI00074048FC|nr:PREDICTED: serine/threonine-protein kinase Nek10 isoform X3 [Lepisosteus oculatus]
MPDQDKKVKRTDKGRLTKTKGSADKAFSDLKRLYSLLSVPAASKSQVGAVSCNKACSSVAKSQQQPSLQRNSTIKNRNQQQQSTEDIELENFSVTYKNERNFSSRPQHKHFLDIFTALVKNRLTSSEWTDHAQADNFLRVLICLRLLMREPLYQKVFHKLQGIDCLAQHMETVSNEYLECGEEPFVMDKLVNMTYIFQKIAAAEEQRKWIIACGAHKTLVKLLAARDNSVLLGALLALTSIVESPDYKEKIGELMIVENLLMILQEYDLLLKRMAAELLRLLCADQQVREQVKIFEGVPILLSLLHSEHLKLLWSVVWILVQLCEDPETSTEIRVWGGIKQLLHILQGGREYVSDRSSIGSLSSANAARRIQQQHISEELSPHEILENTLSLQAACCAALTELVLDDTNAHQVVQENGVYIIGKLILPHKERTGPKTELLQCYAFRALRFLFSMERNRHLFKRLFSTEIFEMFIDIGHYVRDITAYEKLLAKICALSDEELSNIKESIETVNQNKAPSKIINGYAILDHLGSGAFGSVYKVRKQSGQNLFALKEVNLHNPAFGKDKKDRDSSVENIVSELTIIKEQMNHVNIVRYCKTFLENDRLYIVMELIEGTPLGEHFNSLKEKQKQFTEERIWNIFIQICLALRYLHKEKRIVHRDLTPNNIMLGEKDRVTITDFGLAKQKQENSKLTSVVGTILYSCPEIVKSEPYGEKADVWAAGCILYQMVTLNPPFYSTNMLSLATKIVEAVYEPVPEGVFSEKVTDIIKWCLTPDAELRPDIVEVSTKMSDVMMKYMDGLCTSQLTLEKKLDRERRRTQKYFLEANRTVLSYCHLSPTLPKDVCDKSSSTRINSESASFKSESSDSAETSSCTFQASTGKDGEERPNNGDFPLENSVSVSAEKDIGSDEDPDTSDTSNSSTSSPSKDLALKLIKRSISTSGTERYHTGCGDFTLPITKPRPVPLSFASVKSVASREGQQTVGHKCPSLPAIIFHNITHHGSTRYLSPIRITTEASAGIAVSQRKVRQISDPIQRILIQLHKIIYITQLSPALHHNFKRRAIERFKKSLFHPQSNPCNLKTEIKKLLQGSPELIEPSCVSTECRFLCQSLGGNPVSPEDQGNSGNMKYQDGVTYEQMQTMIEEVLEENGYYSSTSNRVLWSEALQFPNQRVIQLVKVLSMVLL